MARRINAVERILVDNARDARDAAGRFGKQVINSTKQGLNSTKQGLDRPMSAIPDNPVRSVLIAAGAAALLGYLLGCRSR